MASQASVNSCGMSVSGVMNVSTLAAALGLASSMTAWASRAISGYYVALFGVLLLARAALAA